jgi:L-lysine exporter family protein LysE/ArgO
MCLAITWLNPHTYLDTVLLLGSVSAGYGDDRWLFGVGAVLGSAIWFAFLTVAARFAAKWLRSPLSWRILDAAIAVVMLTLAMGLALA